MLDSCRRFAALQNLISSMARDAGDGKLTSEQMDKLTERIQDMLGDEGLEGLPQTNDKGQVSLQERLGTSALNSTKVLNEEGLPIVDITEEAEAVSSVPVVPQPRQNNRRDDGLVPLWSMSPKERARFRAHRDRILDILEKEEVEETERERIREQEQVREDRERRRKTFRTEYEHYKAMREMHKKMGMALVKNVAEARDQEEKRKAEEVANMLPKESKPDSLKAKKSVTFAVPPSDDEENKPNLQKKEKPLTWGDVSIGPLRGSARVPGKNPFPSTL